MEALGVLRRHRRRRRGVRPPVPHALLITTSPLHPRTRGPSPAAPPVKKDWCETQAVTLRDTGFSKHAKSFGGVTRRTVDSRESLMDASRQAFSAGGCFVGWTRWAIRRNSAPTQRADVAAALCGECLTRELLTHMHRPHLCMHAIGRPTSARTHT